ncbi:hypothetical protein GCM10009007_03490 [Formosimonas limnophila]|uniref:Uncharacterized protein n=1 Tax=Formosimonas limnophila TaxID=1384487 RepID=A0A8J3FXN8_9BURK|nr:hypothetical protein [Formosimonas limnophila]GHA66321.1 hypothetical protein GCM10009007_03490 [Formosimonas limnophila]
MNNKQSLNEVMRSHGMANAFRQSVAIPAEITNVYDDVIDVKPLQSVVRFDGVGNRNDVTQPLDYEGVRYVCGIGNNESGIYIPPEVGMQGIFIVADFDGDGDIEHAAVRQRSNGWFMPVLKVSHRDELTIKYKGSTIILTESGIDIKDSAGVSLVDAVKELNSIVKGCCGTGSPSAEAFQK